MGRPRGKQTRHEPALHKQSRKFVSNGNATLEEFDDDIDKFHKGRDRIMLDVNDSSELSEGEMEEPVFNMKGSDDDDEEDDDNDLDEEQLSGLAAKMRNQVKILRQKRSLMEDDEEEEEDDNERGKKAPWGKRKKMYYSADNVDFELQSSDEEAPAEEEAEALRLQRMKADSLRPEDFELSEEEEREDMETSVEEPKQTLQDLVNKKDAKDEGENRFSLLKRRQSASREVAEVFVEEVKKDLSLLSKEEKMEVLISHAPELVGLLAELREGLSELDNKIEPVLDKVKSKTVNITSEGLRFLETKHMLFLCYCQSILFYLIMKAEGRSVRDHPVIARLVEIRMLLEKIQPVERILQDQMDKLLSSATFIESSFQNESLCRSGKENKSPFLPLVSKPWVLNDQRSMKEEQQEMKELQVESLLMGNRKEVGNKLIAPEGSKDSLGLVAGEENCLTKAGSKQNYQAPKDKSLHRLINMKAKGSKPVASGDMDLPLREDLGERRTKHEMRRVASHVEEEVQGEQHGSELEEDEFYHKAKQLQDKKLAGKQLQHKKYDVLGPLTEVEVGKRHITYQMEKNKGLTPHRKKLTKNPRKKYKVKHQKAVIRRKGQVREMKTADRPYGGESTGIRTNISRSVRFHG